MKPMGEEGKEHKLFSIIKSDISDGLCKAVGFNVNGKISESALNSISNECTDRVIWHIADALPSHRITGKEIR